MKVADKVAGILLKINAITLRPKKPFRYASGILSPVYTDCRILMSYPGQRRQIRDLYIDAIKKLGKVDLLAGTSTAGIPHASWIADKLSLPMVYVRGSAKDHGKGNQIEGKVLKDQRAVVIEDLISTGESAVTTAKAVSEAGAKVNHIVAIITYGMKKSQDNFKENRLKLVTLTTFGDVVKMAQKLGYINKEDASLILDWTKDPPTWGKRMGFE